jgi:hypothetical protein
MGKRYGDEHGIRVNELVPNWRPNGVYDPRAGLDRNTDIVATCTHAIAFPCVLGSGTQDTIDKLRKAGKPVVVVNVDPNEKVPLHLAFGAKPRTC